MRYDNRSALLAFLAELDRLLAAERPGRKVDLYVIGGAAVVVGYGAPRATMDLDVFIGDRGLEARLMAWAGAGSELEKKHGLYLQAANTTLMLIEEPEWRERSVEILKGSFRQLRFLVPAKEDLILSKLSRYSDKDRADIQFLLEHHTVDPKRLLARYKSARSYYVGNLRNLDFTFNIVLKEHFDLGPVRF